MNEQQPLPDAPPSLLRRRDVELAYLLLRLSLGMNTIMHGVSRLPDLGGFADHTAHGFAATFVPHSLAWGAALLIPIVETVIGGLVLLGLFTRAALAAGALLMLPLIFGICLQQKWPVAGSQLIYCVVYFLLLAGFGYNRWSADQWWATAASREGEGGGYDPHHEVSVDRH